MTYKIRTHNPIISVILAVGFSIPFWYVFARFEEGLRFISFMILFIVVELIDYFLLGEKTMVTVSKNGILTKWVENPLYFKTKKEILWTEIDSWYFQSFKAYDVFSVKTKDKKTYSIRCLTTINSQTQLYEFLDQVTHEIELYNSQLSNSIYEISNTRNSKNKIIMIFLILGVAIMIILFIIVLTDFKL